VLGLNRSINLRNMEFDSDYRCNDKHDELADDEARRRVPPSASLHRLARQDLWHRVVPMVESNYAIQGARDNRGEQEVVEYDNYDHDFKGGNRNYALDYITNKGKSSEAN
jgi:hypothetical protein